MMVPTMHMPAALLNFELAWRPNSVGGDVARLSRWSRERRHVREHFAPSGRVGL